MSQLHYIYEQLQSLKAKTLIQIIDELNVVIPDDDYKSMAESVYSDAKSGKRITHKQKRVLVNIICQFK